MWFNDLPKRKGKNLGEKNVSLWGILDKIKFDPDARPLIQPHSIYHFSILLIYDGQLIVCNSVRVLYAGVGTDNPRK